MSVRIVPARSGKGFEYDIRIRWPEGGRQRERGKIPVTAKDAAKRWAEAREREIYATGKTATIAAKQEKAAPAERASAVPTFEEFWPRVLRDHYQANRKKTSTVESAVTIFTKHLLPALGTKRLDQIDDGVIAALKGRLSDAKPKTVNNILAVLSRSLRCAVRWSVIPVMPCKDFGLLKVAEAERNWYELHDYRQLVDAAARVGPSYHLMVLLGGSAGLRRGEIRALRWCDVDFDRRQIHIVKAFYKRVEDTPKGHRGRYVPMTDELVTALRAMRTRTGLRDRVLYSDQGGEMSSQTIRRWMARVKRRAGLDPKGGIHTLRHTFCSHLAIAGVPAKAIQELAGHADLKTTLRYMHLSPSNRKDAMSVLERFYGSEASGPNKNRATG